MDATMALIAERGMGDVSMTAVAERAGVSRQTLYNHFPDVEAILLAATETEIDAAEQGISAAVAATPSATAALETFVRGTLSGPSDDERIMNAAGLSPATEQSIMDMLERLHGHLHEILVEGVAEGSFRLDLDPDTTSEVLFHMIGSGRSLIHMGRDPSTVSDRVVDLVTHAVAR